MTVAVGFKKTLSDLSVICTVILPQEMARLYYICDSNTKIVISIGVRRNGEIFEAKKMNLKDFSPPVRVGTAQMTPPR